MDKVYRLVIFDVDGALTTTKSGKTFRETADDWQWLPGRLERCKKLTDSGVVLGIATNQAGVAFEWSRFTEAEMQSEIEKTAQAIGAEHVAICFNTPNEKALSWYYHPNDPRRKPNPGMLLEGMKHVGVEASETLFVGDRDEDEQAAKNAGVDFVWAKDFFGDE